MLSCFKSVLNAIGANKLGLQYSNDVDNVMLDYINSNYVVEVENKCYSCPNFLGLTAEETQVGYFRLFWVTVESCFIITWNLNNTDEL